LFHSKPALAKFSKVFMYPVISSWSSWLRGVFFILTLAASGCAPCGPHLTFPNDRLVASNRPQWFDVNHDGKDDFAVTFASGRVDALEYDDDEDGIPNRIYHLRDYANDPLVPHVVILLDSVPFEMVRQRYARGEFRWFGPPTKVIAPFPSLTEVSYSELLHTPPMPGMIDQHYDRRTRSIHNGLWERAIDGYEYPWERYLDYHLGFFDEGLSYLDPRPWYQFELERARAAIDHSPSRITVVYLTSASGMACKYGRKGIDEVLDGAARLCLQLLYERRGAIRISLMADHGHNLIESKNLHIDELLSRGGFHVTDRLKYANDVVPEINGLVTYAAVRTTWPARVADQLLSNPHIHLTMYLQGDRVIVRDARGSAAIESRGRKLRYHPLSADVLNYANVLANLKQNADGFASRAHWFSATVDSQYPDAPARIWDAFHARVMDPPEVMFTTFDGYCAGLSTFARFITMKSTHGSLNQANSATFLMSTSNAVKQPLRTRDVMSRIEPDWRPGVADR
jgi:hypothetical protein